MRIPRFMPLVLVSAALIALGLVGCEPLTSPAGLSMKPKTVDPGSAGPSSKDDHNGDRGERPIRGSFKVFEPVWVVSHFVESTCNGLVAGAEVKSRGNVSHLGQTELTASAAWDWSEKAAGEFSPVGPTTSSSATILSDYPHDFCSQPVSASGKVILEAANGDKVRGTIQGGEVYELGYDHPGDAQEQFMVVEIDGGTGRFAHAEGSIVIHSIFHLVDQKIITSSIMPGGRISY